MPNASFWLQVGRSRGYGYFISRTEKWKGFFEKSREKFVDKVGKIGDGSRKFSRLDTRGFYKHCNPAWLQLQMKASTRVLTWKSFVELAHLKLFCVIYTCFTQHIAMTQCRDCKTCCILACRMLGKIGEKVGKILKVGQRKSGRFFRKSRDFFWEISGNSAMEVWSQRKCSAMLICSLFHLK